MSRCSTCWTPVVAAALASLGCRPPAVEPDVVWISIDTLRYDRTGAQATPNLARFAAGAVSFRSAHAHAPWTKPSMATTFLSVEPQDQPIEFWGDQFGPGQTTVAEAFHRAGWHTAAVVSSDAFIPSNNRFDAGFDSFDASLAEGAVRPKERETSSEVTDLAMQELPGLESPFFLWVHYFDPHDAYLPHPEFPTDGTDDALYQGEISYTDQELEPLLEALDERPGTVVVVHADHGEALGEHGVLKHGESLFEELVHVPLAIRAPQLSPGEVLHNVGLDGVAPTVLALAGVDAPADFEGTPWPVAQGAFQIEADETVYEETHLGRDLCGATDGRFKYVRDRETGISQLFDLDADPTELIPAGDRFPADETRLARFVDARCTAPD
jgi:arylsulfatase A-like enzyme